MVTQVGKDWLVETSPKDVEAAIEKAKKRGSRSEFADAVYDLDFIHLGDFLFKPYSRRPMSELIEMIDAAESTEDLDLNLLKNFKERSNWERYFAEKVDCTDEYLNNRWQRLYDLRNKIAHNAVVGKAEYEEITQLSDEINQKLEQAIEKTTEINIPPQEKELLAEELVSNANQLTGEFINRWRTFEIMLRNFAGQDAFSPGDDATTRLRSYRTPLSILKELHEAGELDEDLFRAGVEVSKFRNLLVHSGTADYEESDFGRYLSLLNRLEKSFDLNEARGSNVNEVAGSTLLEGAELIDNRMKLYKLADGRIAKIQHSRFHSRQRVYWYGIAPNSYSSAKKRGCEVVIFVMGDVGFLTVPASVLDQYLATAYETNHLDGSLRHSHVLVSPPPAVRLKSPSDEDDMDATGYFTAIDEAR